MFEIFALRGGGEQKTKIFTHTEAIRNFRGHAKLPERASKPPSWNLHNIFFIWVFPHYIYAMWGKVSGGFGQFFCCVNLSQIPFFKTFPSCKTLRMTKGDCFLKSTSSTRFFLKRYVWWSIKGITMYLLLL